MNGYHMVSSGEMSFPLYRMALLLLLVAKGPGPRRMPQLPGKPALSLERLPRVVIVGAAFGGIACARALRRAPASITLIDRQNYHLFQPLLYLVATAGLSPADIANPIRTIFRDQFNAKVALATVTGIDTDRREALADGLSIPYDYLVIATGATHSYFGQDAWSPFAPGLKRVEDATLVRRRMLEAFERAEVAASDLERRRLLTFVVVGGGPTGVELAGAIAELALANCWKGEPVPGLAPAAKQGRVFVAKVIRAKLRGEPIQRAFCYRHMDILATIGRKSVRFRFHPVAWRHGLVALGHRPRAVPFRITQPRGSGPELSPVLRNVPGFDGAHNRLNLRSPQWRSNDVALASI